MAEAAYAASANRVKWHRLAGFVKVRLIVMRADLQTELAMEIGPRLVGLSNFICH